MIEQEVFCEIIDATFEIKAVAKSADDGPVEYCCEVQYIPTGNVIYRTEIFVDKYWVRHVIRQVFQRMSSPPRRRRKGLVNELLEAVEREEYLRTTGFYPGR